MNKSEIRKPKSETNSKFEIRNAPCAFWDLFGFRIFLFSLLLNFSLGLARGQSEMQPILEKVKIEHKLNAQAPLELKFRDESGQTVTLGDYFQGKPVILILAYYRCPMLCNQVLNGVVDGLRGISFDAGKEFQVVVVSFDAREQPDLAAAKKATYVEHYGRSGVEDGWHFLTGEQPAIDRLTQAVGFPYLYDSVHDQFIHDSGIMVLTPEGRISRYHYGIDFPPRDLRLSLVESSANRIGSPIDHVMLLCFHYDPSSGRYTATVLGIVRLAGIVTVLCLGVFLFFAWRREIKKRVAGAESSKPRHVLQKLDV
jgi:protein SCO1/2